MGLSRYAITNTETGVISQTWVGELPAEQADADAFLAALGAVGVVHTIADGDPMPLPATQMWDGSDWVDRPPPPGSLEINPLDATVAPKQA